LSDRHVPPATRREPAHPIPPPPIVPMPAPRASMAVGLLHRRGSGPALSRRTSRGGPQSFGPSRTGGSPWPGHRPARPSQLRWASSCVGSAGSRGPAGWRPGPAGKPGSRAGPARPARGKLERGAFDSGAWSPHGGQTRGGGRAMIGGGELIRKQFGRGRRGRAGPSVGTGVAGPEGGGGDRERSGPCSFSGLIFRRATRLTTGEVGTAEEVELELEAGRECFQWTGKGRERFDGLPWLASVAIYAAIGGTWTGDAGGKGRAGGV